MKTIYENWKSTTAGLGIIAVAAAFVLKAIDLQQFLTAFAILSAAGLAVAKDGK